MTPLLCGRGGDYQFGPGITRKGLGEQVMLMYKVRLREQSATVNWEEDEKACLGPFRVG